MIPKFNIIRPPASQARVQVEAEERAGQRAQGASCRPVTPRRPARSTFSSLLSLLPDGLPRTFFWSAVISHIIGSMVSGSLIPSEWPRLLLMVVVLIIAPSVATVLIVAAHAFRWDE